MAKKITGYKAKGKLKEWLIANDFQISTSFSGEEYWTHSSDFYLCAGKIPAYFKISRVFDQPKDIIQLYELVMGKEFPGKA